MPAQYALSYYLGSAIFGSALFSVITFLAVNIPNGTFYLDGFGMAFFDQLCACNDWFIAFSCLVELGVV